MVLVALRGMDRNNGTTTMHSQRLQQHTAPAYCTAASACNHSRWSQHCGEPTVIYGRLYMVTIIETYSVKSALAVVFSNAGFTL